MFEATFSFKSWLNRNKTEEAEERKPLFASKIIKNDMKQLQSCFRSKCSRFLRPHRMIRKRKDEWRVDQSCSPVQCPEEVPEVPEHPSHIDDDVLFDAQSEFDEAFPLLTNPSEMKSFARKIENWSKMFKE